MSFAFPPFSHPLIFKFGAAWGLCSAEQDEREKEASREEEEAGKKRKFPQSEEKVVLYGMK